MKDLLLEDAPWGTTHHCKRRRTWGDDDRGTEAPTPPEAKDPGLVPVLTLQECGPLPLDLNQCKVEEVEEVKEVEGGGGGGGEDEDDDDDGAPGLVGRRKMDPRFPRGWSGLCHRWCSEASSCERVRFVPDPRGNTAAWLKAEAVVEVEVEVEEEEVEARRGGLEDEIHCTLHFESFRGEWLWLWWSKWLGYCWDEEKTWEPFRSAEEATLLGSTPGGN